MKTSVLVACSVALCMTGALASAQVKSKTAVQAKAPIKATTPALTPGKRLELVNAAVKKADNAAKPVSTVPAAAFRLTPNQISHKGAYISALGNGHLSTGNQDRNPLPTNFVFVSFPNRTNHATLFYPTEPNRTYVIDCEVTSTSSMTLKKGGEVVTTAASSGDHMIGAVQARGVVESIHIEFAIISSGNALFKGCDIIKL